MAQTLTLRPARPSDLAAVDRLLQRSYPALLKADYPPSTMVMAVPQLARAKPALLASGTYFLAEDGAGRVIGAGGWTPHRGRLDTADIRHVATDPEVARQGVGRAVLARVFEDAGAMGVTRFDCLATRTAVPFYRAMGFSEIGPVTIELAQAVRFPVVRMLRGG